MEKIGCSHKSPHKGMAAWAEREVQALAPARFENAMRPTVIFLEHIGNVSARAKSFQADDEGSIPFTRSIFEIKDLCGMLRELNATEKCSG